MSVIAKFYVMSVEPSIADNPDALSRSVKMGAVCRGAANRDWASATPAGSLQMTVRNDKATQQFIPGEEYLLTFEHAPKPQPHDGHVAQPGPTAWNNSPEAMCEVCGMPGTFVPADQATGANYTYVWDQDAQSRHDEAYGAADGAGA